MGVILGSFLTFFTIFYDFLRFLEENGRVLCCFRGCNSGINNSGFGFYSTRISTD